MVRIKDKEIRAWRDKVGPEDRRQVSCKLRWIGGAEAEDVMAREPRWSVLTSLRLFEKDERTRGKGPAVGRAKERIRVDGACVVDRCLPLKVVVRFCELLV